MLAYDSMTVLMGCGIKKVKTKADAIVALVTQAQ